MNAARLLALYGRIAEAPDAVARLRRFVLDLAVRGKLVPQDAGDEPASELLKRIARERARLVRAGEIRKPKESPESPMGLPFALPPSWASAPLDRLSPWSLVDGDWIETKDQSEAGNVRLVQLADVGVGEFLDKSARFITEETELRLNCTRLVPGDVLIARLPNPIGRACVFPDIGRPAITAVDVAILRPDRNVDQKFLVLALNAPSTRSQIEAYGKGTTRFRVSTGHLKTVVLPLPPLAEQHRIVAKVDELMALCDRLEAARTAREATRDRLAAASLARLNTPDPETFPADARFALDALPALTTRPDQIKHLRQTILNLAVRGKLVPQDAGDEPASELLERIRREKSRASARATRVRLGEGRPRTEAVQFDIPRGWALSNLGEVAIKITDGAHRTPTYVPAGVPFVSVKDFSAGRLDLANTRFITEDEHRELYKRCDPRRGDILIGRIGTLGRAVLVDTDREFSLFVSVGLIRFSHAMLAPEYLRTLLNSPFVEAEFDRIKIGGGTHTNKLNLGDLHTVALPIPPLAEQHRIVAKVNALMALCDALEASLADTTTARTRLLDATLAEALTPAAVTALEAAE